jgi:hypothetical protein
MQQIVRMIFDQARATASRRAAPDDMAWALVAGLRRLRAVVDASSDGSGGPTFDDAVRSLILTRGAEESARLGKGPIAVSLPAPGPQAAFAGTVIEDAVMSCLGFANLVSATGLVALCASVLVEALVDTLGGIPDPSALIAQIRPEDDEGAVLAVLPSVALQ